MKIAWPFFFLGGLRMNGGRGISCEEPANFLARNQPIFFLARGQQAVSFNHTTNTGEARAAARAKAARQVTVHHTGRGFWRARVLAVACM